MPSSLNTLAIAGPSGVDGGRRSATFVRYLDLIILAAALPVFVVAGFPLLGYAVLAAVWLAQLGIETYAQRRSLRELAAGNRNGAMGWIGATTLGRVWLVATTVLLVGLLADREDGLAAAILSVVLFTVHFAGRFAARWIDGPPEGSPRGVPEKGSEGTA
jgi:hypothetical protein